MEDNQIIDVSESNKGKEQVIINKKYKFNFSYIRKDNSKVYKCTKYKKINKCKSFIILNDKKEILKYDSSHNHPEKEYDVSLFIMKHKIKYGIELLNLNKKLPSNVTTFAEIPSEYEYYKTKRAKLFREYNDDIFVDTISNSQFINPEYIFDIYVIIKIKSIKNNYCQFLKFLEYFYKTYLIDYDMKFWNYYNNMEHITNNASESLNNYLNNLFPTKSSFL
ncbi:hypothetical protein H8356DRAFT_1418900 [Neocallimastix lanati (nom. inval.)]|nr:hypothetical protein H8356DRAFT_1418900 [Neocallimastix sp. JGI-2020a]